MNHPVLKLALPLFAAAATAGCAAATDHQAEEESVATTRLALGNGSFDEVTGFGSNPGALKMYRYTPSPAPGAAAGLVVAMHACTQTASQYRSAGWESLADAHGFYVIYPEQQSANNGTTCFNWAGEYGNPTNLVRGEGENQSIIEMIDQTKADFTIDGSHIYVMGHSGGGAQAALMLATWPDVFAGAGIIAGIPYNCTTTFSEVFSCLNPGKNKTPQQWGDAVRDGFPGWSPPYPKVSIWHGSADTLVSFSNLNELAEQWTNASGIDFAADVTDQLDGHTRNQYQDGSGTTLVETIEVAGAGHGTFVDPDAGCGSVGGYFLDYGTCAALRMAESWGLIGSGPGPSSGAGGNSNSTSSGAGADSSSGSGANSSGSGASGPGVGGDDGSAESSSGSGSTNSGECTPGRQITCSCQQGYDGVQACNDEGNGYSECSCDAPSGCAITRGRPAAPAKGVPPWALALALGASTTCAARRRRSAGAG